MEIVLDTSAIISVIVGEPEGKLVVALTQNSKIVCPSIISFEVANAITRMIRKGIITKKDKIEDILRNFETIPIKIVDKNPRSSLEIAWSYKIYAYDAFFLDTAKTLSLPLLTFDDRMRVIGKELGINILGG